MMMPDGESPAGLVRRAEIEPVSALAGHRQAFRQRSQTNMKVNRHGSMVWRCACFSYLRLTMNG